MSGSNNSGNRQDNRQRGNAAQLLEKYKSMARDSQLAGDRVQTEYYLQFADHYFRVLGDSRPRDEQQQRRQRGDDDGYDDDNGDDRMDADMDGDNENDGDSDDEQQPQPQSRARSDEQSRARSDEQPQRSRSDEQPPRARSDEQPQRARSRPGNDRPEPRRERANGRPRDEDEGRSRPQPRDNGSERIDFAVLPPAIGTDDSRDFPPSVEEQAPAPKRRSRRPRVEEAGSDDASAS